jgi:cellulose biosynthesis protein BcsQ
VLCRPGCDAGSEEETAVLPNAVAITNGKGGVGKTSLSANLAGIAARDGWRVLLVDLDPQGNLSADLGYVDDAGNDAGYNLLRAVETGQPVEPLTHVRPGLDVVTGGDGLDALEDSVRREIYAGDQSAMFALHRALAPLSTNYNLIVIDCPPSMGTLIDMSYTAANYLVIPTRGDAASLNGLTRSATRFVNIRRSTNPQLSLLGVALFGFGAQDVKLVAKARSQLTEALAGIAPVFESFIRATRKAPDDMREYGMLAHEYLAESRAAPKWYQDRNAPTFSASADGLAEDYQRLSSEILTAFSKRQRSATAAA